MRYSARRKTGGDFGVWVKGLGPMHALLRSGADCLSTYLKPTCVGTHTVSAVFIAGSSLAASGALAPKRVVDCQNVSVASTAASEEFAECTSACQSFFSRFTGVSSDALVPLGDGVQLGALAFMTVLGKYSPGRGDTENFSGVRSLRVTP